MKRKDRDELINLAFGDLRQEDAERVARRAASDAESRRELQRCNALRDSLVELREVPEDQMSVERLRDAALSRGLRSRPQRPWIWVPVAAASFAVAIVATKGLIRPNTVVELTAPNVLRDAPNFVKEFGSVAIKSVPSFLSKPAAARGLAGNLGTAQRFALRKRTRSRTDRNSISIPAFDPIGRGPLAFNMSNAPNLGAGGVGDAPSAPNETGSKAQSIVLINASKDKNAAPSVNNATEVDSGTNVIVSG